jgi:hypothetical protein
MQPVKTKRGCVQADHPLFVILVLPQPKKKGAQSAAEIQVSRISFLHRIQGLPHIQRIFLVDMAFAVNAAVWGQAY